MCLFVSLSHALAPPSFHLHGDRVWLGVTTLLLHVVLILLISTYLAQTAT